MNGLHELSNIYDLHCFARPMLSSAILTKTYIKKTVSPSLSYFQTFIFID